MCDVIPGMFAAGTLLNKIKSLGISTGSENMMESLLIAKNMIICICMQISYSIFEKNKRSRLDET